MSLPVAVDARTLQRRPLGGVARSLLGHLRHVVDHVDITLLTDARLPAIDPEQVWGRPQIPLRAPSRRGVAWLQLAVPRALRQRDGIFHCPFYGLPFRQPLPMVVTIHDITFEQHPDWFTMEQRLALQVQARWAARTAAHVLTPSAFTRQEVLARYRLAPDRVSVAPNLLDAGYGADVPERPAILRARGVTGPYVLALGGAARRGVDILSAAWPAIHRLHPAVALVVVGDPGTHLPAGVTVIDAVSDDDWRGLLGAADLFCYPTRHEGFGYPALEACAVGTPVVCARVGALPEVLGDAAEWMDDLRPESCTKAVTLLLRDGGRRGALVELGLARAAASDPTAVRDAVLHAFESAAR